MVNTTALALVNGGSLGYENVLGTVILRSLPSGHRRGLEQLFMIPGLYG